MNIVIVGTGNVANFFAKGIADSKEHRLLAVYARTNTAAVKFAHEYSSTVLKTLHDIPANTDLVLLCVPDAAIGTFDFKCTCIVAHCSGTATLDVLEKYSNKVACVWPIYSITLAMDFIMVPMVLTAHTVCVDEMRIFCDSLSADIFVYNQEQKAQAHLVATIGNNFPNFLFAQLEEYCHTANLPKQLFLKLFRQPVNFFAEGINGEHQTGPAIRKDENTISAHEILLEKHRALKSLYQNFTTLITQI
jgi:predicted short-subunit dehydrogenase-like oxidoreductase (DUF2520 family)